VSRRTPPAQRVALGRRAVGLLLAGAFAWPLAQAQIVEVLIQDYMYAPATLTVKVGTTVKWVNNEKRTTHSILFTGPGGFESERIFPGESWQRTFDRPGAYAYTCGPHPEMKGKIDVTP
jgi:plastocyanin